MYVWQREGWPKFRWSAEALLDPLAAARHRQGVFTGSLKSLGFELRAAARLQTATEEVVKSSAIEGETLDARSVRSSAARRLGVKVGGLKEAVDQKVEGVVAMTLDATLKFDQPLTLERLCGWQAALFPGGFSGLNRIITRDLRDDRQGPMQVVSGSTRKRRVHFEAPPADRLPRELAQFLSWFEEGSGDGLLRAGLAHLWFVTIHPFEDGNGRIARAITDMALARLERQSERFYSLSSQLKRDRDAYYDALEHTQRGTLDVTTWLKWFVDCFARAVDSAEGVLSDVMKRATFANRLRERPLNERQRTVMNKLLAGIEGNLTAKRWAVLAKTSVDTAQRDIKEMLELKLLVKNPGGSKNTSYALKL